MPSNQIKNFTRQHPCHHDKRCINIASFFSKTKISKEQLHSRILELRITFVGGFENIRFGHYFTKQKSMLERKLLAMLVKNPENNIHRIIPTLLLTIPCGLSFLCSMSLMVYTLIKPLFNNKGWIKYYT